MTPHLDGAMKNRAAELVDGLATCGPIVRYVPEEAPESEKNVMVLTGEFIAWRAALDGWGSQSLEVGNENVVLKFFRDGTHVRLVFTVVIDRFGGVAAALSFNGEAGELLCLSMLGVDMALNALRTPVEAR